MRPGLSPVKAQHRGFDRLCKRPAGTSNRHSHACNMALDLKQRSLVEFEALCASDLSALLARSLELQAWQGVRTAQPASGQGPLHGKKLGLVCGPANDHDAQLFTRAATALGAQVATLRPSLSALSTAAEVQRTARVLGRLYDALDCIGMPHDLVLRVGVDAGVPVFDGLASAAHPAHRLAHLLATEPGSDEWRCVVIQAVLLGVLC